MTPAAPLRVNLLGFGAVGQSLARLLSEGPPSIGQGQVRVVAITDQGGTLADPSGVDLRAALEAKRAVGSVAAGHPAGSLEEVARAVEADVVVDVLPTNLRTGEPARAIALTALRSGRHLVTAGKSLLALHGREAIELEHATGRRILGSAAVLGSTPALELLAGAFRGDRVTKFQGVLNGSTNVILSHLENGASWSEALADAQGAGVLEADPSLDLQGLDAAAKAVILANHAWGHGWTLADARIRGIEGMDPAEVRTARARGQAVRLVATGHPEEGVSVAPVTLPRHHPLVVDGAENALRLELAAAGTVTLRGPGAGGRETAAAVLSDLLALQGSTPSSTVPPISRTPEARAP